MRNHIHYQVRWDNYTFSLGKLRLIVTFVGQKQKPHGIEAIDAHPARNCSEPHAFIGNVNCTGLINVMFALIFSSLYFSLAGTISRISIDTGTAGGESRQGCTVCICTGIRK